MKKCTLFSAILLFAGSHASAQFMHSLGGGFNVLTHKVDVTTSYFPLIVERKSESLYHGSVDYFPRYNLTQNSKSSLSIGLPVSLGLGSADNGYSSGLYFAGDVSLGAYFNSGLKSSEENESKFGYFLGAGFSYGHVGIYLDEGTVNVNTYGPMVNAGLRFPFKTRAITVSFFLRRGIETDKFTSYGLKLLEDF